MVVLFCSWAAVRAADNSSSWLMPSVQNPSKVSELAENTEPLATGYDCLPTDFHVGLKNDGQLRHGCAITTAIGSIASGYILAGDHGTLPLNQHNNGGGIIASPPGMPNTIISSLAMASGGYGAQEIHVSTYDPSLFKFVSLWGWPLIYEYQYAPAGVKVLVDSANKPIPLLPGSIAYSNNSAWMVMARSDGGIMRFDTKTWVGKLIAWDTNYSYAETRATNFAISDSGEFIAVNTNIGSPTNPRPSLRVYDVHTCEDQSAFNVGSSMAKPCTYNDIWNGITAGKAYGGGIGQQLTGAEYPRHIRFVNDNVLSFDTIYARTSPTTYKVANYQIGNGIRTIPQATFDLLALGDSYISGEGIFQYRSGTDTTANKCHNSALAYPYILGERLTTSYNSVACSGATTDDITNEDLRYLNQLRPRGQQGDLTDSQMQNILAQFIPGNVNQLKFIESYHPNKILLSIGGNNIHFSDIVTLCVLSTGNESCFDSSAEREALLQYIYDQHDTLVGTYTDILQADSGAKLYVIGYPQIAKVGGNCGLNVHMNASELEFGSLLISRLNATIRNAAESAGARYVDVENAFTGSMLCETGTKAVNGLTTGNDVAVMLGNESYHPTAYGHVLLANAISRQTDNLRQAMPAPTHAGQLTVNSKDRFITGASGLGGLLRNLSFVSVPMVTGPNIPFHVMRFHFDTQTLGISPGTAYAIVYHSQEVQVANGMVPADGIIDRDITVPNVSPGTHELHLYAQDHTGTNLDIMQAVYVVASETDYDGDGIANVIDSCPMVANSGIDTDGDGVDDACDGDTAAVVTTNTPTSTSGSETSVEKPTEATSPQLPVEAGTDDSAATVSAAPKVLGSATVNTTELIKEKLPQHTYKKTNTALLLTMGILLFVGLSVFAVYRIRRAE